MVHRGLRLPVRDARERPVALAQGAYYLATGLWSLVDLRSFQAVTGPKVDTWLVRTVGVLVGVMGGVMALGALRGEVSADVRRIAVGSAFGLAVIDVVYVARGRISPVYLLDALAELGWVGAWALSGPAAETAGAGAAVGAARLTR